LAGGSKFASRASGATLAFASKFREGAMHVAWPLPEKRFAFFSPPQGEGGSPLHLLQNVHGAGTAHADDMGEADPRAFDLARPRFAPEMRRHLIDIGDSGGTPGMAL